MGALVSSAQRNPQAVGTTTSAKIFLIRCCANGTPFARCQQSANPRKLLTGKHVHHAGATNASFHQYIAGMIGGDCADHRGRLAERVRAHRSKNANGIRGRKNREEFTFIGDIKRIETEDFACSFDFFADGKLSFIGLIPKRWT